MGLGVVAKELFIVVWVVMPSNEVFSGLPGNHGDSYIFVIVNARALQY
jgi:hypothetical protein